MSSKKKNTATSEDAKPPLVPRLRFPEFQDAWEMTPIGGKVDLLSGYPFDGHEISQDGSGVRLLRGINITEGRIRHSPEIDRFYTGDIEGLEKFRVRLNDLVIGMDGSKVGKNSALISEEDADALLIQRVARLRTASPTLIQFIFQHINSATFHSYVDKINTSSGIPHISAKQIRDFTIGFPAPAEQQKIAECLSSVDELIAAQARKVDALKTHKKGLMQQLFPREGETQPRLRFAEFKCAGKWEGRLLESLIEEFRGKSTIQDEYEVMTSARSGLVRQRDYYDNDRITERDNVGFNVIPPGYITYRSRSDDRHFYFNENNLGITGIVSVYYPVFRVASGSNGFLVELLSAFSRTVGKYSVGTSQTVLSLNQLGRIRLPFPPTEKEQQRIASCLSSLDVLFTTETRKLEALKTHKKGLMQQLFPSLEGIEA